MPEKSKTTFFLGRRSSLRRVATRFIRIYTYGVSWTFSMEWDPDYVPTHVREKEWVPHRAVQIQLSPEHCLSFALLISQVRAAWSSQQRIPVTHFIPIVGQEKINSQLFLPVFFVFLSCCHVLTDWPQESWYSVFPLTTKQHQLAYQPNTMNCFKTS
jgi:hypothetical protein